MNHTCLCLQFRLQLMGEPPLRCLTCQGKFGRAVAELRCNVCVALFRLQCLLVSDEFPAEHIQLVYPEVRGAYLGKRRGHPLKGGLPTEKKKKSRLCKGVKKKRQQKRFKRNRRRIAAKSHLALRGAAFQNTG